MSGGDVEGVGLAEALEGLRADLEEARLKAAGTDLQFPIDSVTVELKVVATRSVEGKVGFKVPLVPIEFGGGGGGGSERTQTLTLVLGSPVDSKGEPVRVAEHSDELKG